MPSCGCLQSTKDFISGMGLGMIADQLADLKLGELLDTPPPGLDEAVAIAKVRPHLKPYHLAGLRMLVLQVGRCLAQHPSTSMFTLLSLG